jgi:hypothetical protein
MVHRLPPLLELERYRLNKKVGGNIQEKANQPLLLR